MCVCVCGFGLDLSLEQLRVFVREHSSVYMVLKGCLEQYDKLALRFVDTLATTSAQSPETLAILTEAEEQLALLSEKVFHRLSPIFVFVFLSNSPHSFQS